MHLIADQGTSTEPCSRLEDLQIEGKKALKGSARKKDPKQDKNHCLEGLLLMETFMIYSSKDFTWALLKTGEKKKII